jgi:DnaD/phage-associated family protein
MKDEEKLLTAGEANKLLASADGNAALLYLHILTSGGFSLTAAAAALRCTTAEGARAAETLRRLGLIEKPQPPLAPSELPAVKTEDVVACVDTDSAFRGVVAEAEKTLGRVLSAHDLELLFGLYDTLGLPADVIMLLLHHCVEEYQTRNGPGRMPTMRQVEKEGWHWAGEEIMTLDAAEAHLQRFRERKDAARKVKDALQIRGREFTPSEQKYVESWLALGFDAETIAIAYDRTVSRTGRLAWKYMDTIMQSWNQKGLTTPEAIEKGDPMQRPKRGQTPAAEDSEKQIDDLRKVVRHISGGKEG